MTNLPAEDALSKVEGKAPGHTNGDVNADDDFQREMFLYVTWHIYFVLCIVLIAEKALTFKCFWEFVEFSTHYKHVIMSQTVHL